MSTIIRTISICSGMLTHYLNDLRYVRTNAYFQRYITVNVALSKIAAQSSNHSNDYWLASAAVDGCHNTTIQSGCCTHTAGDRRMVWWRVDLGQLNTIDSIQIIYRANFTFRLAGYELYVSNITTSPTDGVLCYHDISATTTAVQLNVTHQCPSVGRYVTVYNYRNDPKRYSWYSVYAVLELCEVIVYGCPAGSYGDGDCSQVCPATCYGGNCNPKTGSCLWCIDGKYGDTCDVDCSVNCRDRLCDGNTGYCGGCVDGKYGDTCDVDCSVNCKDRMCDENTGHCAGCVDGKYGDTCDVDCSVNCKDRMCDANTGHCAECLSGKFGNTCNQDCSINCKDTLCVMDGGDCIECVAGKFGNTCEQSCFVNCKDRLCVKDTGNCTGCKIGKYGEKCSMTCPVTCKDFVCDQQTGQCLECYPGKYGVVCGADCPSVCTSNMCEKNDGHCITTDSSNTEQSSVQTYVIVIVILAVVCGLVVAALIAAIIYHCRYRRSKQNSPDKRAGPSDVDSSYTSIDHRQVEPTNVYEMMVT
ncbi:platelet endothelial aggregation receptor 1-like [Argopecten irradians]|uniref:platelet endothelial aggregation receptor 1-like n=1 Tax=Argopecten irradians TaxID=31199 RepID=UPI00371B2706